MYERTVEIRLGRSRAGLSLMARVFTPGGVQVGNDITAGFREVGGGDYVWKYALFSDGFEGTVEFFDDQGNYQTFVTVVPDDQATTLDAILAAVQQFNPSRVVSSAAVIENGHHIITVRGDSYTVGSVRGPLEWTPADGDSSWPDLTGASVVWTTRRRSDDVEELAVVGQVLNPAGPAKKIRVALTAAQTAVLTPGPRVSPYKTNKFDVQVTLADGTQWTPIRGGDNLGSGGHTIIEDQTRAT